MGRGKCREGEGQEISRLRGWVKEGVKEGEERGREKEEGEGRGGWGKESRGKGEGGSSKSEADVVNRNFHPAYLCWIQGFQPPSPDAVRGKGEGRGREGM